MAPTVIVGETEFEAEWTGDNPGVRDAVVEASPVSGTAHRWGDELYASVPIDADPETTDDRVPEGGVAYWPEGPALCVFWGPTPASQGDEPRGASPVATFARIESPERLADLDPGAGTALRFEAD